MITSFNWGYYTFLQSYKSFFKLIEFQICSALSNKLFSDCFILVPTFLLWLSTAPLNHLRGIETINIYSDQQNSTLHSTFILRWVPQMPTSTVMIVSMHTSPKYAKMLNVLHQTPEQLRNSSKNILKFLSSDLPSPKE